MRTGCFLKILLLLAVIVGAWEYWSWVEKTKARVVEIRTLLAEVTQMLSERQKTWSEIEQATSEVRALRKREDLAIMRRDQLGAQLRRITGDIKYLSLSMQEAVEKVRKAAIGTQVEELKLEGRESLKNARILKITDNSVTFLHEDGVANIQIETDKLPSEWLQRYDLGSASMRKRLKQLEGRVSAK
jgi:SUMO ligase MMS21 Smc5/6 complex component